MLKAWQHLTLAGLIPGSYIGYADGSGNYGPGIVSPPGSIAATNYIFLSAGQPGGAWPSDVYGNTGNLILWSGYNPSVNTGFFGGTGLGFMSGQEAYMFDRKFDDGSPAGGSILSGGGDHMGAGQGGCTSSWYVGGPSSATYLTASTTLGCVFYFRLNI